MHLILHKKEIHACRSYRKRREGANGTDFLDGEYGGAAGTSHVALYEIVECRSRCFNGKVNANVIGIKPFEFRDSFDIVGQTKACSCAVAFSFTVSAWLGGGSTKC